MIPSSFGGNFEGRRLCLRASSQGTLTHIIPKPLNSVIVNLPPALKVAPTLKINGSDFSSQASQFCNLWSGAFNCHSQRS